MEAQLSQRRDVFLIIPLLYNLLTHSVNPDFETECVRTCVCVNFQKQKHNVNTHQLHERQPSIAVSNHEDVFGVRSGNEVVPHIKCVLLG